MYLIVEFAHRVLSDYVKEGDIGVDATCGNGYDTFHLANLVGPTGKVYAFDIQDTAINNTKNLCKDYSNIEYIKDSHEKINDYVKEKVKAVIYNLGYLPKGNKEITTLTSSTLKSIESLLPKVNSDHLLIVIVVYPGHEEGRRESESLLSLVSSLDKNLYIVSKYENLHRNLAPYVLTISTNQKK